MQTIMLIFSDMNKKMKQRQKQLLAIGLLMNIFIRILDIQMYLITEQPFKIEIYSYQYLASLSFNSFQEFIL